MDFLKLTCNYNAAILYKLEQRDSSFELKRIVKSIGRKIVTKTEIYPIDRPDLTLEKTISVSELGTIKVKNDKKLSFFINKTKKYKKKVIPHKQRFLLPKKLFLVRFNFR